ncbi:MAG: alpha-mannosidase [Armatimonadetes bacterium]|nr:alpha-mannosidase [Armatimonadota bacterium]
MSLTTERLYRQKIRRRKDEIYNYRISNRTPISDITIWETPEFLLPSDVRDKKFKSIKIGQQWGGGVSGWFRVKITIPEAFRGREVAAFLDMGGEACAFLNGKPYQGVDGNHQELLLAKRAQGGESFEFLLEASAHNWHTPSDKAPRTLQRAELATRNPEVEEYWFNVEVLLSLAEQLPEKSARRARIVYALNKSVDAFDYTHKDDASLKKSALRANAFLKPVLDQPACPSATNVAVHGHSHIDVAWLWPYNETRRKCARTFSTVMRMMEQYPEYIFSQSQAQLYEFTRQRYPELYEDIKKAVKKGHWDVEGSMWVEADCNLSSGESLIRQVVLGKNFFMREFGKETHVLWLPDVFGYAAALPQILQKARVPYFSTIKINWSQFNTFPYNTFWWEGIDGTRVLAHFPPTTDYNAYVEPAKLIQQVDEFKEKDRSDWSLLSYGWGDGGGGADRRHFEFLRRSEDTEGLPRCKQTKIEDFFRTIDDPSIDYPTWVGELYLELHRGTYTTQARNKRYNRIAELKYRDAELFSSVASHMHVPYPYEELHKGWQDILVNQFHDVIPGSSVHWVYEDTNEMYPRILEVAEKATESACSAIVENINFGGQAPVVVVFNSLPWERRSVAHFQWPADKPCAIETTDGQEVPIQRSGDLVEFTAKAPSMGYATYRVRERRPQNVTANTLKASKTSMENRFYKIAIDNKGVITSILHKESGRELLPEGERGNLLRLYEDKPLEWQAWDIDFFYEDKWEDVTQLDSVEVLNQGPVSASVEFVRSFGASHLKQKMTIYADDPRIDFVTWVDWREENKCLKACFPVDVNASKARYEIQFGNVERATHTNTSWDKARFEVCAHRWADISEQGFGMSLMNDCKYGHHTVGNEMRLTLLRAPKDPDPQADMGEHLFTYSIMPHAGDYISAQTVRRAYELNVPLKCVPVESRADASEGSLLDETSFFNVDAPNVILETVKRAENSGDTIIRLYECHNQRAHVSINVNLPFTKVYETDLMEDNLQEVAFKFRYFTADLKPFEIKTFKLVE